MPCGGLLGRNVLRQAHRALRLFCLSLGGSGSRRNAVEYPVCLLQGAAKRGEKGVCFRGLPINSDMRIFDAAASCLMIAFACQSMR
jgi:hypothetical protein